MAYYSNQGATIHSGAAGVGAAGGPLRAFQDGSLGISTVPTPVLGPGINYLMRDKGGERVPRDPIARKARLAQIYGKSKYGRLRADALRAFKSGGPLGAGPLMSYQDGSLGAGPLMSFKDGSLGMPLFLRTSEGTRRIDEPVEIIHAPDPSGVGEYYESQQGVGEYYQGVSGCGACNSGMGQTTSANLDLKDPAAVLEVKTVMGMAPWMMPHFFGDMALPEFDEAFFHNPIWDASATKMALLWMDGYSKAFPSQSPDTYFVAPNMYPSSLGAIMILSVVGYGQPVKQVLDFTKLSVLTGYFDSVEGNPDKGSVTAPYFSAEEAQAGPTMKASTLALAGAGVVALLAVVMLFKRKKAA